MSRLYLGVKSRVQSFPPPPILPHQQPIGTPLQVRQLQQSGGKPHINPSILVILIILSVVFICSGILHILARCLGRRRARAPEGDFNSPSNSIRGQLQHLFSLHDSGVEQVFIDTLPVFLYGAIRGLKDSADCAVCLNEFANEDRLRLLPKCKHAFHLECIDTWLLSNSTCPLCRRNLLPEADPVVFANSDSSNRESSACVDSQGEGQGGQSQRHGSFRGSFRASLRGSFRFLTGEAPTLAPPPPPPPPPERETLPTPVLEEETETPPMTPGPTVCVTKPDGSEKVLRVELGKVTTDSRRISRDVGTSRGPRSYSMGSYEYVVDFSSLGLPREPQDWGDGSKPTHRSTLSDGIPELASASHTPGEEDMFWARRGLETPHNLSRVREMMTPSPRWLFESPSYPPQQDSTQQDTTQQVQVNINRGEEEEGDSEHEEIQSSRKRSADRLSIEEKEMKGEADELAPSLSLRLFPLEDKIEACNSAQPTPQELAAALRKDKVWEVSVDVMIPSTSEGGGKSPPASKKSSPLNWLRGRGRRLVYSAASPSSTDIQASPESKVT